MFEGFALDFVDAGEATLRVRYGGSGPPVLLLHGHPRTHATLATSRAAARPPPRCRLSRPARLAAELLAFLDASE